MYATLQDVSRSAVSPHLYEAYDFFRNKVDPFNLADDIATMRTLMVEVRETIENDTFSKVMMFGEIVEGLVLAYLLEQGADKDEAAEQAEEISRLCIKAYNKLFGDRPRISAKEALDMAKAMELTSKVCERYKKMCDGVVLRIDYDKRIADYLQKFAIGCMQYVQGTANRRALAQYCYDFIPNLRVMEPLQLAAAQDAGDVIDEDYDLDA